MQHALMQLALQLLTAILILGSVLERVPREDLVLETLGGAALADGDGGVELESGVAVRGEGGVVVEAGAAEVCEFGRGVEVLWVLVGGGVRHGEGWWVGGLGDC